MKHAEFFCSGSRIVLVLLLAVFMNYGVIYAENSKEEEFVPRIAVRSNMLYDLMCTPTLGLEFSAAPRWSFAAEGMWAWWSNHKKNRCWRIYGGWIEMRRWLGNKGNNRLLTGHHFGLYGSYSSFDFEFGGTGYQSPQMMSVGVAYGYSVKVHDRLNIDFTARAGYAEGRVEKYKPQCGSYVGISRSIKHYLGLTGVEISLVWFPGKNRKNNPLLR